MTAPNNKTNIKTGVTLASVQKAMAEVPNSATQIEFEECPSCAAKPGSPVLCSSCLSRRTVVDELNGLMRRYGRLDSWQVGWYADRAQFKTVWVVASGHQIVKTFESEQSAKDWLAIANAMAHGRKRKPDLSSGDPADYALVRPMAPKPGPEPLPKTGPRIVVRSVARGYEVLADGEYMATCEALSDATALAKYYNDLIDRTEVTAPEPEPYTMEELRKLGEMSDTEAQAWLPQRMGLAPKPEPKPTKPKLPFLRKMGGFKIEDDE